VCPRANYRRVRGDAVGAYANVDKAKRLLGWTTQLGIDDGIASALEWGRRRDALLGRA
jgi:UDP-glucose 4-epimerase